MRITVLLLFLFLSTSAVCQEQFSVWSSVNLQKKISKKTYASGSFNTRFSDNVSYLKLYFAEIGLGVKPIKNLDVSVYYRNIHRKKDSFSSFITRHRFYGDASYGIKAGDFKIVNRLRYQHQFKDNGIENEFLNSYIREKIGINYSINKKLKPGLSADFFYNIQDKSVDQVRPKISISYKPQKRHEIELGFQKDIGLSGQGSSGPIALVDYTFSF